VYKNKYSFFKGYKVGLIFNINAIHYTNIKQEKSLIILIDLEKAFCKIKHDLKYLKNRRRGDFCSRILKKKKKKQKEP
jgi:hypothetical protein